MLEVRGDNNHTITCTRLALLDGSRIFLCTKWFRTSFSVTALDFPRSWSCHVAKQEVEDRASTLGIRWKEFFSQAREYLGDGISDSQYSFAALGGRPNEMRLSWTTGDMSYNPKPRVSLYLQEDNCTMELVPEFLNVLMDTTLKVKDLLARRKINKSKKVRQLAMRFSASEKARKRSLSQQTPVREGMCGGLDGLVVKSEFPNSIPKFYSSTVSYEPASGLSTPTHPPSLTTLDGRGQQHELRTPAIFHDVAVPKNIHKTPGGDKAVLCHESRKPGVANSGGSGWINPRHSSIGVDFELSGSKRRGSSQAVIMLSDSEEDDDEGLLEHVSKVKDERSRSRLESEPLASIDLRSRSRKRKGRDDAHEDRTNIFIEGQQMQSNGYMSNEHALKSRGSLSRNRVGPDVHVFVPAGTAPCIKAESEYQSEQNAVWQYGDHRYGQHPSTFDYRSRAQWKPAYHTTDNHIEKFASSFNYENRAQWNTWISEAKTEVTSWEAPMRGGNSVTGGSGCVGNQLPKNVGTTSSPCDSNLLAPPLSLKKLDRNLDLVDFPRSDSEHVQSPRETLNVNFFPSEENSGGELLENLDRRCAENRERSHTRELDKSNNGVSSDVPVLEKKVKVEREFVDAENGDESDSVEEHVFEPGLHNDTEVMTGAGESVADVLETRQREKAASIWPPYGRKEPRRRGRPPSIKVELHPNTTKSASQGTNTCTDGTTLSGKNPRNTNLLRVSRTSKAVGRPKHSDSPGHPSADVDQEQQRPVPDSDCYCFDGDRVKERIKPNEVWAVYHGIDTMPRSLIRVKEVSTNGAFWVKASWLQHIASKKNERQKETLYSRSCGEFEELKETRIFNVVNCFSHKMEFTPKLGTVIQVYPRKGEVWALHRKEDLKHDRSEKAKQGKGNEENGSFRLVVILSNCGEGRPSEILVLRKRTGYRTLWEPGYERGELPIGNMGRFSHRVPAYKLTEKDYKDLNNSDIWDIDAAAVPECQSRVT